MIRTEKLIRVGALVIAILVAGSGPVQSLPKPNGDWPASSRDKRVEKTFEVKSRLVSLDSTAADIVVKAIDGERARLVVELEFWSSNEDWMQAVENDFDIEVRETTNRVELRLADMQEARRKGWFKRIFGSSETYYALEITLELPRGTDLAIDNRYGDVEVLEIGGSLEIVNSSGDIRASGAKGGAVIENSYGDATVTDIEGPTTVVVTSGMAEVRNVTGDVEISNRYGEVVVTDIEGSLDIESSSSEIEVQTVSGPTVIVGSYADAQVSDLESSLKIEVSSGSIELASIAGRAEISVSYGGVLVEGVGEDLVVRSSSGEVEVRDIQGSARIENSYGSVVVEEVGGGVEINNPSGGVRAEQIGGDLSIRSSYEIVRVRDVTGDLVVSATSSGVTAEDIGGGAEITTSYAGVELVNVGGPIDVRNQSGRVEVRALGSGALKGQNRVETSYADIDFSWPDSSLNMSFSLESTYGDIHSEFAATNRQRGSRESAEGTIGSVSGESVATVTLTARSGSVFLRKD